MPAPQPMRHFVAKQIALVALLPVAIVALLVWLSLIPQMRTSIGIQQHALARSISGEIWAHLMGGERQMVALADAVTQGDAFTPAQVELLLDAACGEGELFESIYIVRDDTRTIGNIGLARPARSRREDLLGLDIAGRPVYGIARQERKIVWSETFLSTVSSHLAVAVALPLHGRVIVGEMRLDRLSAFISQLPVESGLSILILDRQGRIVADSQQDRWGEQMEIGNLPTTANEGGKAPAAQPFYLYGDHMVGSMVAVERLGWKVLVAQPYRSVFRPVRAAMFMVAIGLAVALILTLSLTWMMATRFVGLIAIYISHAKSIARGEYGLKWPTARTLEYQSLGENLRTMAKRISRREEMLRRSEERLDLALSAADEGIWDWDIEHGVLHFDDRYYTICGYEPDEFPATFEEWEARIHPADARQVKTSFRQYLSGALDTYDVEYRFLNKGGAYMWIQGKGKIVSRNDAGDPMRLIGIHADITDRKRAEEEIRQLRNYLANIINSMPSVLVGVDVDGAVTQWNRQAEQATGLSFESARARPLGHVFPRLAGELSRIKTAIRERRVLTNLKVPRQASDDTCYEDITIFPLEANGAEGAVIRVDDVTERVRLEELMIQSEKMLSIGGLAAGMAHEINNPLAGILQNVAVLHNRLLQDLPPNQRAAEAAGISLPALRRYLILRKLPDMIDNIRSSGLRATTIVKNMLGFARKSDRVHSSHDICALLDQTLALVEADYDMKKNYDFKKIRIEKLYDDADTLVPCEAGKIQQVFLNLLKNGAEAMAGVGVAGNEADPQKLPVFTIRVKNEEDWVRVEIEDNGPGMDAKTRRSVFEPFFTTKPVGKGTGLGLSVSYFIVTEDHGGEMRVEAAENGGTRFVIRLPRQGKDSAP